MTAKKSNLPPEVRIEAICLVALRIDAEEKRGTPEHAEALALSNAAIKIWREQLRKRRTCPHCGHER